ncbi:hypothetical protein [Kosakonia phage 305]|jgi:hypothetical protein|uniref:T4 y05I-like putative transcription factor C-terminal domain-containing protein n=1 Tax=Kosakonia phage 305 TaxID=2863193 RepID=A0AAE7WG74_9CAUD|nr:hypothetical protein PP421_gp109 [Kosakonia phage 305]QYN80260.1 hypothetical protein [Kosakonia phage 305]
MKIGLNYEGRGFGATIHNEDGDDDIEIRARSICENTVMTITQGRDVVALYKSDIIALRDYLVQITPIL